MYLSPSLSFPPSLPLSLSVSLSLSIYICIHIHTHTLSLLLSGMIKAYRAVIRCRSQLRDDGVERHIGHHVPVACEPQQLSASPQINQPV